MTRLLVLLAVGFALAAPLAAAQTPLRALGGETVWLHGHAGRVKALVFRSADAGAHPRLIVVLHGDSPHEPPGYQYRFAAAAAQALHHVVVAGILRPGYGDPLGDRSDGERGLTTGDNYTIAVADDVAGAAAQLHARFATEGVTLVGHSGGAAIAADVMERHPDLASRALLVSCPCDLAVWRAHMMEMQHSPIWRQPISAMSPSDHVEDLARSATLLVIVGADDDVAPPAISRAFVDAARRHGVNASLMLVANAAHNILLEAPVMTALEALEGQLEGAQ